MTTVRDIAKNLGLLLAAHPIYGARQTAEETQDRINNDVMVLHRDNARFRFGLSWERTWGVAADLHVSFLVLPVDNRGRREIVVNCDISWSSTGRNVARATAAIALYREVTVLAALIQATFDGETLANDETTI